MKLIDAEPIIKNLSAMETQLGYDAISIDGMLKALREAEEIEAAPVVHGRWIRYSDCGVTRCSNCNWNIEECFDSNYCPNCGAKMDLPYGE